MIMRRLEAELQSGQHSEEAHKLRASVLDERVAEVSGELAGGIMVGESGRRSNGEGRCPGRFAVPPTYVSLCSVSGGWPC